MAKFIKQLKFGLEARDKVLKGMNILADFDKKFHKRIWNIVKEVNPQSYVTAETTGTLDGDGPQIYGEIKEFIRELLKT